MNQYANDFTQTVKTYYQELKKCKPMSKAKEKKLFKKCKEGSIEARNEILASNLRFVFDVARKYKGKGLSMADLISEGNMGLLKAIDRFDENKDVRFITYAIWWIKQAIHEALRKKERLGSLEIRQCESETFFLEDMKDSEERPYEPTGSPTIDLSTNGVELKETDQETAADRLLSTLDGRERKVIELYYGISSKSPLTLTDIGNMMGISSERARQIKISAMRKMRSTAITLDYGEELLS